MKNACTSSFNQCVLNSTNKITKSVTIFELCGLINHQYSNTFPFFCVEVAKHTQTTYKKSRHAALVYLRFLSTEGKQKGAQG